MNSELFSLGTKPVIDKLEQVIPSRVNPVDTVMLNIGTIVRNCAANETVKAAIEEEKRKGIETDHPAKVLYEEATKEMMNFIQYVCQIFSNSPLVHNPTIITYHADYSKSIPEELYRKPQPSKRVITMCDEMIRRKMMKGSKQESKVNNVKVVELPVNDKHSPWRWLYNELKDVKNNHLAIMISSHPSDYHVGPYCRTFRVLRSYTGNVVQYKDLCNNLFDTSVIPFNQYTHAILGDKEDIKPTVKGAMKTKLLEAAEREEWSLKTQDYIRERLYRMKIRIPVNF